MTSKREFSYDTPSLMSIGNTVSWENPKFHLNLLQKKDLPSDRPVIHATKAERLAFYRGFTSTSVKTDIIPPQHSTVNSFLWFYFFNCLFKSMPHSFVHFFLAAYAPEEHMFITKMVPFSYGSKYLFVLVGFLDICTYLDMMVILFHYTTHGVLFNNPWSRCLNATYFDHSLNNTIHCFNMEEFAKMFVNKTVVYEGFTFKTSDNKLFQVSYIEYYRLLKHRIADNGEVPAYIILFILALILHLYSRSSKVWKVLTYSQYVNIAMDAVTFAYLVLWNHNFDESTPIADMNQHNVKALWSTDLEVLAESITAPPVVHVLTSRSSQEIDPATDSTVMIVSNALMYIFKGLLNHSVIWFCQSVARTQIPTTQFNQHSWFYFWPMMFQSVRLGNLLLVLYFLVSLITEFLILIIIIECVIESVIYEWRIVKRWMAMAVLCVGVILVCWFTSGNTRIVLWAYGKTIATLSETIFIYTLYPIGRLVDDYTFHYGEPPTTLRILSLRLIPIYYIFKTYTIFESLWYKMDHATSVGDELTGSYKWSWSLMVAPVLLGTFYTMYYYLVRNGMTWTHILRPVPEWGPRDFFVRQLRKQYDSRFYIASEVPRLLSRYIISKRESKVYKVDVRYSDRAKWSLVSQAIDYGKFTNKKKAT